MLRTLLQVMAISTVASMSTVGIWVGLCYLVSALSHAKQWASRPRLRIPDDRMAALPIRSRADLVGSME